MHCCASGAGFVQASGAESVRGVRQAQASGLALEPRSRCTEPPPECSVLCELWRSTCSCVPTQTTAWLLFFCQRHLLPRRNFDKGFKVCPNIYGRPCLLDFENFLTEVQRCEGLCRGPCPFDHMLAGKRQTSSCQAHSGGADPALRGSPECDQRGCASSPPPSLMLIPRQKMLKTEKIFTPGIFLDKLSNPKFIPVRGQSLPQSASPGPGRDRDAAASTPGAAAVAPRRWERPGVAPRVRTPASRDLLLVSLHKSVCRSPHAARCLKAHSARDNTLILQSCRTGACGPVPGEGSRLYSLGLGYKAARASPMGHPTRLGVGRQRQSSAGPFGGEGIHREAAGHYPGPC